MVDSNQNKELSRRKFIINSTGIGFTSLLVACGISKNNAGSFVNTNANAVEANNICILTPQMTEGPYYVEGSSIRKDIREDFPGKNLLLKIQVVDGTSCLPVQNALVNIWHCNAVGIYSGFENMNPDGGGPGGEQPPANGERRMPPPRPEGNRPPPPMGDNRMPPPRDGQGMPPPNGGMGQKPTSDKKYLRGVQPTNEEGVAEFQTIYPGWYSGRAVHIHLKVFLNDKEALTSQLFFKEDQNDMILTTVEPYKNAARIHGKLPLMILPETILQHFKLLKKAMT